MMRRVAACGAGSIANSAIVFAEVVMESRSCPPPTTLPFGRGGIDRLSATQALAFDLAIITDKERDFADIPALRIENWTRPAEGER